ncbi:nucleoside diphosphate kinase regulator [Desulfatitalea alkaliphila]|uniref:Nucleoside diphosphate kinase regulator n=1 Tax=Desulfatitalea alkaliphila TaxID=2929485 RepID=A0AA41RCB9_9BACT|nr:nucleoside diphosphate kinase regulator [Desulfatitalea alkaliphila]MCJ8502463.1 nucleoside diphosphate kinase regulator [Desulfatitalea alkaliphila]
MTERTIYITQFDKARLEELIAVAEEFGGGRDDLEALADELDQAEIVTSKEIGPDVVTMNAKVVLRDLDSDTTRTLTLVFPRDADAGAGAISVLAPIGTAILGYAKGDEVKWRVPGGVRRIRIEEILYQPEAAGDYHL